MNKSEIVACIYKHVGRADDLENLSELVEEIAKIAAEEEREACAQVCDSLDDGRKANLATRCAEAIRERSNREVNRRCAPRTGAEAMNDQNTTAETTPAGAASALDDGLGIPTDAELLANQMQFGADIVTKYSRVCKTLAMEVRHADELLRALRLDPEIYRTECGYINMPKVRAALAHQDEYPMMPNAALTGATPNGGASG